MNYFKILNSFFGVLSFVCICCSFVQAQVSASLSVDVADVSELNIGFNRRSDNGTWWTDNSFIGLVSEMNPDVVRYPGGTQANYWDWRTGQFLENTDKSWGNKEILRIPEFIAALPSRTKIVYVINMARPTPATEVDVNASEAILKSQAILNAKINDMLDAIAEFTAYGKEPYAIELGNEFYFGNIESGIFEIVQNGSSYYGGWDALNNQPYQANSKANATVYTAQFYVEQCNTIVSAIKAQYPNIKIVLTTTKEEPNSQARERWNTTVFNELNTNYPTLKNNVYAVTQHHYLDDKYGIQTVISDNISAKVAIAEGIQYPIYKQSDYDLVPNDYKIWYTEYGEVKAIADETWASGVRYAALVYSWIARGDKVGQLDYHYISDANVIKLGSPMVLAPVGIAAKLFAQAAANMDEIQDISFTNNPESVNGVSSLYGYKFKNNEKETLLIINTSDNNFTDVQFDNLFTYSGQPTMTQYYSNAPYVSGVFDGNSNIQSIFNNVNNTTTIKNFSITVIESNNSSLGVQTNILENISIYPNPVKNILNIKSNDIVESVSVFNVSGIMVYNTQVINKSIDFSSLKQGLYFIEIKTDKIKEVKKLIKE